jgi:hypothetical protein
MWAHFEPKQAIIRVFQDGAKFHDPFDKAVFASLSDNVATLEGLRDGTFSPYDAAAIARCLAEHGYVFAQWIRYYDANAVPVVKRVSLRRFMPESPSAE